VILAREHLWLPGGVRNWTVQRDGLNAAIKGSLPALRRIERHIRPRWKIFILPPSAQYLGLQTLVMAIVLLLPIPGGNWPPGMTVAATGLALAQRDGRLALVTAPMAAISIGIAWIGFRIGLAVLREAGHIAHGLLSGMPFQF
jgi:hypothetical protein